MVGSVLVLAGCSGGEVASPPTVTHTVTADAATVTHEVEVTVTAEPTGTDEPMVLGLTGSEDAQTLLDLAWGLLDEENRDATCDLGPAGRESMAVSIPEVIGADIPADVVLDYLESVC